MHVKRLGAFFVFSLVFITALCFLNAFVAVGETVETITSVSEFAENGIVILDAGHGDFDPGCVAGDGTEEKWINLEIALYLRDIFTAHGYQTIMTRVDDTTLADETGRRKTTDTHNRAALFDSFSNAVTISIHQNSFTDRSQHGTQLFYGVKNDESKLLAEHIMASVVATLQPNNERPLKEGTSSIYILKNVNAPIVLVECGFMTNEQELEKLKDREYCRQMAYSIFLGYESYLSARHY